MAKTRLFGIVIIIMVLGGMRLVDAATVALRNSESQQSEFEANVGESFEIEIFVQPEGESLAGVSIYLSFDNQFLELLDADPAADGIQPIKAGELIPPMWQEFDNDTHGDPGNELAGFQIDYVRLSIDDNRVTDAGVIGRARFRPIRMTASTTITLDSDAATSRLTEATIVAKDNTERQVAFSTMTPAQIAVGGAPLITMPFPEITLLMGATDSTLDLDTFVTDSNDPNEQLTWKADGNENITVDIDSETHVVTFGSVPGWAGVEEIRLTAADPQGNAASDVIRVRVMSAPAIRELPAIRVRVGEKAPPIDLNDFATDTDDPDLAGLKWELSQGAEGIEVDVNGSIVTIGGNAEQFDTPIEFTVTDGDGNRATATMLVSVLPDVSGPIVLDVPDVIATNDGQISMPPGPALDLDLFVFDAAFEPDQIQWTTEGNRNVLVDIAPTTHIPVFRSENGWTGAEEITFVATNPNQQRGTATATVTLIEAGAPPKLAPIPPVRFLVNEAHTVDLKGYVFDLNSTPDQMRWESSGHERIQIDIDQAGIATFSAAENATETITITAIDPDGNRASTDLTVIATQLTPPQISELPDLRLKASETRDAFDLNEFVTDPLTPPEEIQWVADGFQPANLTVEIAGDHRARFTARPNWYGEETVTFTATNNAGLTATDSIRVVGTAAPVVTFSDTVVEIPLLQRLALPLDEHVEDADTPKDQIAWHHMVVSSKILVTVDEPSRTATIEAPEGSEGEYEVTFTASDPDGNTGEGIYRLRVVVLPKTPPVIEGLDNLVFTNDASYTLELDAVVTDVDTPIADLTWSAAGNLKTDVQIDENRQATLSAPPDYAGAEEITFTVTDPDGQSDSRVITVTVKFPPSPPVVAELPEITFHQRQTYRDLVLDDFVTDEDTPKDQIQWRATGQKTISVEIDPESHRVTFKSLTKEITTEEITFTAEDPDGENGSATTTVSVVEAPPPEPPALAELPNLSIRLSQVETEQISISLSDFVTDEDTPKEELTWHVAGADAALAIEIDPLTQVATFTPAEGFVGEKMLTVTVTDPEGQEAKGELKFTVIDDRPKPPGITNIPSVVTVRGGYVDPFLDLDDYVSDPDTPRPDLRWTVSTSLNLQISVDPETHIVEITPTPGFLGEELVTFTVTDPDDLKAEADIQIRVLPPNPDAKSPVLLQSPSVTLEAGQVDTLDLDGLVSDEDTPDARIRWSAAGQKQIAIAIDPKTRVATIQLAPDAEDFRGVESITLTAIDPDGKSGSTLLHVTVQEPPDVTPPTFEIYVLPNPIQPEFLTITVLASEALLAKPTVTVDGKFLQIDAPSTNAVEIWTGIYLLPKNFKGRVEIRAKGVNLAGLEGESSRTFPLDASLAAPTGAPSLLRVCTYPNPAVGDAIWVECQIDRPTTLTIQVYTASGELVKTMADEEFRPAPGRLARRCRWHLRDDLRTLLPNGTYFCYAIARNGTQIRTDRWKMAILR